MQLRPFSLLLFLALGYLAGSASGLDITANNTTLVIGGDVSFIDVGGTPQSLAEQMDSLMDEAEGLTQEIELLTEELELLTSQHAPVFTSTVSFDLAVCEFFDVSCSSDCFCNHKFTAEDPHGSKITFSADSLPGNMMLTQSGVLSGEYAVTALPALTQIYFNVTVTNTEGYKTTKEFFIGHYNGMAREQIFSVPDSLATVAGESRLGINIKISRDESTVAVAGWQDDTACANCGAIYVYRYFSGALQFLQVLTAWAHAQDAYYGGSLFVSDDASLIATAASAADYPVYRAGVVYIYELNTTSDKYEPLQLMFSPDPDPSNYRFGGQGILISQDNEQIIHGSHNDMSSGITGGGAVYIWQRQHVNPEQDAYYLHQTLFGTINSFYGYRVETCLEDSRLFVGAPLDELGAGVNDAGRVYIYEHNDFEVYEQVQYLEILGQTEFELGTSIAVSQDGDHLVLAAAWYHALEYGWVGFYSYDAPSGTYSGYHYVEGVKDFAHFGLGMAMTDNGDTVLLGSNADAGHVQLWTRDTDRPLTPITWTNSTAFYPNPATAVSGMEFGARCAISSTGRYALIGARQATVNGVPLVGEIYFHYLK